MGFFYFFNCIALAGGPHVIAYKAAGLYAASFLLKSMSFSERSMTHFGDAFKS